MILRKRSITIALATAGILVGAHAGIAAINTEAADPVALQSAVPSALPSEAPATPQVQAPSELQADAQTPVENIVQPKWQIAAVPAPTPQPTVARDTSDEYYVRIPFTNKTIKVTNPTFPRGSSEFPDTPPSVIAYFDAKNANTVLVGAASPVFPGGSEEHPQNPAVIAYFDRLEAQRVAAAEKLQQALQAQQAAAAVDTQATTTNASAQSPGT